MNINYVDYDVLSKGIADYAAQAEAITGIVETIKKMNGELQKGFINKTASAFVERIDTDHIPKLKAASDALQEVSNYLKTYSANRQHEDEGGAGSITVG